MAATDMLEKKDIRKKAAEAKKKMDKLQHDLPKRRKEIQDEAQAEIDRFNQSQEINPLDITFCKMPSEEATTDF